jgi:hypothetical protein
MKKYFLSWMSFASKIANIAIFTFNNYNSCFRKVIDVLKNVEFYVDLISAEKFEKSEANKCERKNCGYSTFSVLFLSFKAFKYQILINFRQQKVVD